MLRSMRSGLQRKAELARSAVAPDDAKKFRSDCSPTAANSCPFAGAEPRAQRHPDVSGALGNSPSPTPQPTTVPRPVAKAALAPKADAEPSRLEPVSRRSDNGRSQGGVRARSRPCARLRRHRYGQSAERRRANRAQAK